MDNSKKLETERLIKPLQRISLDVPSSMKSIDPVKLEPEDPMLVEDLLHITAPEIDIFHPSKSKRFFIEMDTRDHDDEPELTILRMLSNNNIKPKNSDGGEEKGPSEKIHWYYGDLVHRMEVMRKDKVDKKHTNRKDPFK